MGMHRQLNALWLMFLTASFIAMIWIAVNIHLYGLNCDTICAGCACSVLVVITGIISDIRSRDPSDSHSWSSLYHQYYDVVKTLTTGRWRYAKFIRHSLDVAKQQEAFLVDLMREASHTEYGKTFRFTEIDDLKRFRQQVPLSKYDSYRELVDRMIETDAGDLVSPGKAVKYGMTSGTTGLNKHIPYNNKAWTMIYNYFHYFCRYVEYNHGVTSRVGLGKLLELRISHKLKVNRFGKPIAGVLVLLGEQAYSVKPDCMRGHELSESVQMYIQARIALQESKLQSIQGSFPTIMRSFVSTIESRWQEICDDIERGTLTDKLDLDLDLRRQIVCQLKPDKARADELRMLFGEGFDKLLSRVWPELQMVAQVTTGAFTHESAVIRAKYLNDSVMMKFNLYGGTEGLYGITMPGVPDGHYVPMLPLQFLEFIPRNECELDTPTTRLAHQLVEDEEYEVVSTGMNGVYRYRTGDVVKVKGYWNQLPVYRIEYRLGQLLNLFWEKTPEGVFQAAIDATMGELTEVELVSYTATENIHWQAITGEDGGDEGKQRFYVLFIEIQGDTALTAEQKTKFDENLIRKFDVYGMLRKNGSISPMQVIQVQKGTFLELKLLYLELNPNTTSNQFKQPRAIRDERCLELVKRNIFQA
ncbi:uncharacterized protein LOC141911654 isoform X2 [Tubulanus polymorphus]|uniref:uncharacterized protein LOC141911654 isoform X2 n=2 Tax=Tubulanus polymorphus TaxID=672921 RepID=UPI003DA43D97